jgi:hypothetical protein
MDFVNVDAKRKLKRGHDSPLSPQKDLEFTLQRYVTFVTVVVGTMKDGVANVRRSKCGAFLQGMAMYAIGDFGR